MKRPLFVLRTIFRAAAAAVATVLLTIAVSPAQAATSSAKTSMCQSPTLSQSHMAWGTATSPDCM